MSEAHDKSFHKILDWLEEVNTNPLLLELLTSFWHGEEIVMDTDFPPMLQSIYQTIRDIGLHQTCQGFLSVGMVNFQQQYYQQIGGKRTGKQWGVSFCG